MPPSRENMLNPWREKAHCSGQTDSKQQVERTYFSFDCSLCCHTLLKLAFLIQFTKSVEHQPQPVLIKCPCPKVFQCGQSMTVVDVVLWQPLQPEVNSIKHLENLLPISREGAEYVLETKHLTRAERGSKWFLYVIKYAKVIQYNYKFFCCQPQG